VANEIPADETGLFAAALERYAEAN